MTVNNIIKKAIEYLGANEGGAKHKEIIDGYNTISPKPRGYTMKYTDAWCMAYVSFVFQKLGVISMLHGGECSCSKMITLFKAKGEYFTNSDYKVGDILMYDWGIDSVADHVGIITSINSTTLTVIEGNKSDSVSYRNLLKTSSSILGYGRPKYSTETETTKKTTNEIANEVIKGLWGNGTERQSALENAGYNYSEVQSAVNTILGGCSSLKSNDTIAGEVVKGLWGNGTARKTALENAGYDYGEIQKLVNKLMGV